MLLPADVLCGSFVTHSFLTLLPRRMKQGYVRTFGESCLKLWPACYLFGDLSVHRLITQRGIWGRGRGPSVPARPFWLLHGPSSFIHIPKDLTSSCGQSKIAAFCVLWQCYGPTVISTLPTTSVFKQKVLTWFLRYYCPVSQTCFRLRSMLLRTRLSCQRSVYGNALLAAEQNILITGGCISVQEFFQRCFLLWRCLATAASSLI